MFVRLVAGFVQAAAGVAVGVWGYSAWRTPPVNLSGENAEAFVHGASSFLVFLFATLRGWLAMWLFVEGLLRALAAAMEQPLGTVPLVIARAALRLGRPRAKMPDDLVATSADGLVIDSARDYDWHALTTVDVAGALYAVAREAGTSERPQRYRLTPIAHDHVVRTVSRYPPLDARGGSRRPLRRRSS